MLLFTLYRSLTRTTDERLGSFFYKNNSEKSTTLSRIFYDKYLFRNQKATLINSTHHGSLLPSRYLGRHATFLPTNGCSRERHIAFPLFLRTNRMHVIGIGYANQIPRYIPRKQRNKILLQRDLFLPAYSGR